MLEHEQRGHDSFFTTVANFRARPIAAARCNWRLRVEGLSNVCSFRSVQCNQTTGISSAVQRGVDSRQGKSIHRVHGSQPDDIWAYGYSTYSLLVPKLRLVLDNNVPLHSPTRPWPGKHFISIPCVACGIPAVTTCFCSGFFSLSLSIYHLFLFLFFCALSPFFP